MTLLPTGKWRNHNERKLMSMKNIFVGKLVFILMFFPILSANAADNQPLQYKSELVHPRTDPKQIQEVLEKNKQTLESKAPSKKESSSETEKFVQVHSTRDRNGNGTRDDNNAPGGSVPLNVQTSTVNVEPFTGSANLSYPIQVPPGRAGIQPNLALTYSSSFRGVGLAGVGWTLDLGSIQLSTKKGVPKYDGSDIITLIENGSSEDLIYDSNAGSYRTELEGSFDRIQKVGDHWEITDKKGVKYFFGNTDDSRQYDPANVDHVFCWALNRVEDLAGNYMTISYVRDQGHIYPKTIDYTGFTSASLTLNPYAQITINYEPRSLGVSYISGFKVVSQRQISDIAVSVNGINQSKYQFTYLQSRATDRNVLHSIAQVASDGSSLPPVIFTYNDANLTWQHDTQWNALPTPLVETNPGSFVKDWGVRQVDINSDGYGDFIQNYSDCSGNFTRRIFLNNKNKGWNELPLNLANQDRAFIKGCPEENIDNSGYRLIDVDSDGHVDASSNYKSDNAGNGINYKTAQMNNGALSFISDDDWLLPDDAIITLGPSYWWNTLFEDVNGDGFLDIIIARAYVGYPLRQVVYLNRKGINPNDKGWILSSEYSSSLQSYDVRFNQGFKLVDLNADGLSDIIKITANKIAQVFMNTGHGWVEDLHSPWRSNTILQSQEGCLFVDLNADGLPDFFNGFDIYINTGYGWAAKTQSSEHVNIANGSAHLLDIDGDGLIDILTSWGSSFAVYNHPNSSAVDLLIGINNGIGAQSTIAYDSSAHYNNTFLPFTIPVVKTVTTTTENVIGRSIYTTTRYDYTGGLWNAAFREFQGFEKVKVTDKFGNYSQTTYLQDHWLRGRVASQETYDAQGLLYSKVINQWQSQDIAQNSLTQQISKFVFLAREDKFLYDGSMIPKRIAQVFTYGENPQYGDLTSTINYGEVDPVSGNDIGGDFLRTNSEYVSNTSNWLIGLPKHVYVQDINNATLGQMWFNYDGSGDYNAAPNLGRLTRKTSWLGGSQEDPAINYTYDEFGNLKTTIDPLGRITSITYDNDVHMFPVLTTNALGHAFKNTYYGVDGNLQDNGRWGQVKSKTDANNQTVQTLYDGFGRSTLSILPLDSLAYPSTEKIYEQKPFYTKITTKVRIDHGKPETIDTVQYFDGLGVLNETKSLGPSPGQVIVSGETEYDDRGLPFRQYKSRFTTNDLNTPDRIGATPVPYVEKIYDAMGRVIRVNNPDGTYSSVSYDRWMTTTIDENGHMQKSYVDAFGRLVKKEEYLGADGRSPHYSAIPYALYATTNYVYDVLGHLISVKDAQNNITNIQYDNLGRKIAMTDPDMGNWQYSYDANGNMIEQTDAKGKKIRFAYDALNRLINKNDSLTSPTMKVDYQYDLNNQNYAKGRLGLVNYGNDSAGFSYDELGREVGSFKKIDGATYTVSRQYNILNQIKQIKYPNGREVNYSYNQAGQIVGVKDTEGACLGGSGTGGGIPNPIGVNPCIVANSYVVDVNYNAQGQMTQVQCANGVTTAYVYNPYNSHLDRIHTSNAQGFTLQDLNYTYDSLGQITSITDTVNTATQQYKYDALNRLTYAQGSYGIKTYAYDSIGNIIQKDGLTYAYGEPNSRTDGDKAGPHAVTSLSDGTVFKYDLNGNMVSLKKGLETTSYIYDVQNRLTQINTQTTGYPQVTVAKYSYDGDGGRTKKIVYHRDRAIYNITGVTSLYHNLNNTPLPATDQDTRAVTTRYVGNLYEAETPGTTGATRNSSFVYLGNTRVSSVNSDNSVLFYHNDYLGGTNVLTDNMGNKRDLTEYDPFGLVVRHERYGNDFATIWSAFTSKNLDDESGLMFYGARYYNPKLGRFITPDTIVQSPSNPQTLNRYAYCNNNPVNNIDPSGHSWFKKFFKAIGIILGGAILTAISGGLLTPVLSGAIAGATIGGAVAAATGGNIGRSMLTGAIGGAIFGGIGDLNLSGGLHILAHFAGGAASGAINGMINHGDIGLSMLTGAVGAGVTQWAGTNIDFFKMTSSYISDLARRSVLGGIVGGAVSTGSGGKFASGFKNGLIVSAISYTANDFFHNTEVRAAEGSRWMAVNATENFPKGTVGYVVNRDVRWLYDLIGESASGNIGYHYMEAGTQALLAGPATFKNLNNFAVRETTWWNSQSGLPGAFGSIVPAFGRSAILMSTELYHSEW